jgi:hypothetical protein
MSDQQWGQQANDPQSTGQPGPAPAYGQAPAAQGGYTTGRPPIPGPVALAVKLMYAGAALSLLGVIAQFLMQDQMRELVEAQPGMTSEAVDAAVSIGLVLAVVVGLVGVGLWVLNAVFNAKGKNWARILSTVLAGLNILFTLFSFAGPAPMLSRILAVLGMLLSIAIVVLLWRPENKPFYAPQAPAGY